MNRLKTIVVKVGTNVISTPEGMIDHALLKALVNQLVNLKASGYSVILVSSGAVGAGKAAMRIPYRTNKVVQRQVYSAVGQIKLMNFYDNLFNESDLHCAQILATKEDFRDRNHYLNMKSCFKGLLRDEIIPIVNENDVTSVTELMFTDNDELAGLIASMLNAEKLVILTNVDGVFNGHPDDSESQLIKEIDPDPEKVKSFITPVKSSFGRGGMLTKIAIAQKLSKIGISTYIANGKNPEVLSDIAAEKNPGTLIRSSKKLSNLKKWMAFQEGGEAGTVIINEGAKAALRSHDLVSSLLFVGIVNIEGDFKKHDIIRIIDEKNQNVGIGLAGISSEKAKKLIGKKGEKPLIHYNYLLINN
ncbi:MAG: glutamate 5-kinase [Bacteroidota bacterium]